MAETKKIEGNAGGEVRHKGDLIVTGDVAAGAKLYIENGGLIVEGNVQDGALIEQRNGADGSSSSVSVSGGGNINISGSVGRRIIVNGVDVTEAVHKGQGGGE